MTAIAALGNGLSGLLVGGYIAAVVYQSSGSFVKPGGDAAHVAVNPDSNLGKLVELLSGELGYVEVVVAGGALALLYDVPRLRAPVGALLLVATIAVLIGGRGPGPQIVDYLKRFGRGQIGLFGETVAASKTAPARAIVPSTSSPALPAVSSA